MEDFALTHSLLDRCHLIRVEGDLDADTAPWLERELDKLQPHLAVVIDLSRVKCLTSAGLVALLRERVFGRPALNCPDDSPARKILEIVQAHRVVPIYRDVEAALAAQQAA